MEKETSILLVEPSGYFILCLEDSESKEQAMSMLLNGEEVLFGGSEDLEEEEFQNLKSLGYTTLTHTTYEEPYVVME